LLICTGTWHLVLDIEYTRGKPSRLKIKGILYQKKSRESIAKYRRTPDTGKGACKYEDTHRSAGSSTINIY
jgi:hypothetical protein